MKLRSTLTLVAASILLAACNFTLAADITPPPDYIPPTPMPTLGPLYPLSAPDVAQGAALFAEHCLPCHGAKGLGDGPQSMQLPVTVPGLGLPEEGRAASPADWFRTVTQGNLDRFMPPFSRSLSDQQRWDVVAYALTLHATPAEIARGRSLVEAGCPACPAKLADQERMAALSEDDLVALIRNGDADIPAFGKEFSDQDAHAAAEYLRSLTLAAVPQVASASTPAAEATPAPGGTPAGTSAVETPTPAPAPGVGKVTGSVEIPAGGKAESLTATLHGYDHAPDQTSGPQEVLTVSGPIAPDGSYTFEDVGMPENRIFIAEVNYAGIAYRSGFEAATATSTEIQLPPLRLYEPSTDVGLLRMDQVHIYTDFATAGSVQVLEIFAFTNGSSRAVVISTDGTAIPFIRLPEGATNQGYEAGKDSAPFVSADQGVAVIPSEKPYSIIAFFSLPYENATEITQPVAIDMPSLLLLVPDGVKVQSRQLTSRGLQAIQNTNYEEFAASRLKAGDTLSFSVSGRPRTSSAVGAGVHQGWLIGGAFLGLGLVAAGLVLYVRERRRRGDETPAATFQSVDEVLDAILALDDLHQAGRISDKAYQVRRDELKGLLRDLA